MELKGKKALVVYFSHKGMNFCDGKVIELTKGNTEVAAGLIAAQTGAEAFQLRPKTDYPFEYKACVNQAVAEMRSDARPELAEDRDISGYDVIFLGGGHVPTQNHFFQELDLRTLLQDYPGIVLGISAGSMNAADRVYVQPEEEGESAPDFPRFAEGLGITDLNILPHYQQVKDYELDGQRLFEDITYADSMGECFFALPDGSYFLVEEDGNTTLFGEAYCIQDGVLQQIAELGDVLSFEDDEEAE